MLYDDAVKAKAQAEQQAQDEHSKLLAAEKQDMELSKQLVSTKTTLENQLAETKANLRNASQQASVLKEKLVAETGEGIRVTQKILKQKALQAEDAEHKYEEKNKQTEQELAHAEARIKEEEQKLTRVEDANE